MGIFFFFFRFSLLVVYLVIFMIWDLGGMGNWRSVCCAWGCKDCLLILGLYAISLGAKVPVTKYDGC